MAAEEAKRPLVFPLDHAICPVDGHFDRLVVNLMNDGAVPAVNLLVYCRVLGPPNFADVEGWCYGAKVLRSGSVDPPGTTQRVGYRVVLNRSIQERGIGWHLVLLVGFTSFKGESYKTYSFLKEGDADWRLGDLETLKVPLTLESARDQSKRWVGNEEAVGRAGPGSEVVAF
jgi:hypothetical protein